MATDFREYVEGTQHLKEPAGELPSAKEVADVLNEEQDGYAPGGFPVS